MSKDYVGSQDIDRQDPSDKKILPRYSIIDMSNACKMISLNEVIHFYSLIDFSAFRVICTDFKDLKVDSTEEGDQHKFYTTSGVSLLH